MDFDAGEPAERNATIRRILLSTTSSSLVTVGTSDIDLRKPGRVKELIIGSNLWRPSDITTLANSSRVTASIPFTTYNHGHEHPNYE